MSVLTRTSRLLPYIPDWENFKVASVRCHGKFTNKEIKHNCQIEKIKWLLIGSSYTYALLTYLRVLK